MTWGGTRGTVPARLDSVLLPSVVHEATAAVLIVDLRHRSVVHANDLAAQLAPDVRLPIGVDEWSLAAGLEDVAGDDLPEGSGSARAQGAPAESLLRVAQGEPVTGEAVTARHATRASDAREVLWVLGLSLTDAPEPMSDLALVVFVPARNAQLIAGVQQTAATTRERAVLATRVAFTITDPNREDDPLVWVNPAFTATTGYPYDESVGRNCRFLQGPDTDRGTVAAIASALAAGQPLTTTLLNYRKDGTPFWNELSISPIRDETGRVTHFVGVQADVTERIEAQRSRDAALTQVAQAADRLSLLADLTARLAVGQTPEQLVAELASALVPRIGALVLVSLTDGAGQVQRPYVVHDGAGRPVGDDTDAALARLAESFAGALDDDGPIMRVLRARGASARVDDLRATADGEPSAVLRILLADRLDMRTLLVAPLRSRQGILGVVALAAREPAAFDADDAMLLDELALRGGLMLENAQLYARERAAASTLQRSLLPTLPRVEGLEVAASYVPAADEAAVGGDWYDVFTLQGGTGGPPSVGVVVGDVMGHNFDSAARMGKLSTIVRAYAWPGNDPHTVLTAVDELLAGTRADYMATCFFGRLRRTAQGATLAYSSAGHPPALLRLPDGTVQLLDAGRGAMIGVSAMLPPGTARPPDAEVDLPAGSTLICFTDGLTDGFGNEPDLEVGLAELARVASHLPLDASPREVVAAVTGAASRHDDDVAVVALRVGSAPPSRR